MNSGKDASDSAATESGGLVVEEESTAEFQPVVVLDEVEVVTGEEMEEIVWSHRAKSYVYDETLLNKGKGTKTWNEKGIGDVKLLKNKESGMIRLLMRQLQTEKILMNHQVDPRITIIPLSETDRVYCYSAFDFSNGVELVETGFAVKFKDKEIADTFKDQFISAQQVMKALGVGVSGEEEAAGAETGEAMAADDVADALAGLSTSEDAAEGKVPKSTTLNEEDIEALGVGVSVEEEAAETETGESTAADDDESQGLISEQEDNTDKDSRPRKSVRLQMKASICYKE